MMVQGLCIVQVMLIGISYIARSLHSVCSFTPLWAFMPHCVNHVDTCMHLDPSLDTIIVLFYTECYPQKLVPPPIDIQICGDLVVWQNAPNIFHENIVGYEIRFVNSATNEEVIKQVNASATFFRLDEINSTFKSDLTSVKVGCMY